MTKIEAQTTDEMKIPGAALASTMSTKDRVKVSPIKNTKESLELRIDKLEKIVAEFTHKNT